MMRCTNHAEGPILLRIRENRDALKPCTQEREGPVHVMRGFRPAVRSAGANMTAELRYVL